MTEKKQKWLEPRKVRVAHEAVTSHDLPLHVNRPGDTREQRGGSDVLFDPRSTDDQHVPMDERQARLRSLLINYHSTTNGPQMAITQGFRDHAS